jgi:SAM-dependent methyltransferase
MLQQGAEVVSIDLSSAIDVVARKLRAVGGWCGAQGDITRLPLADGQFDVVYCEGVIQHTRDSAATVRELKRMLVPGGVVLATHYELPSRLRGKVKMRWTSLLRRRFEHMERYKLLFVTGALAALGSVPLLGRGVRLSGTAFYSELMPDFRTTWTNTFDFYGNHAFQRHITPAQFWKYFEDAGEFERLYEDGARVVARYTG